MKTHRNWDNQARQQKQDMERYLHRARHNENTLLYREKD
jgi:hypothetical protein